MITKKTICLSLVILLSIQNFMAVAMNGEKSQLPQKNNWKHTITSFINNKRTKLHNNEAVKKIGKRVGDRMVDAGAILMGFAIFAPIALTISRLISRAVGGGGKGSAGTSFKERFGFKGFESSNPQVKLKDLAGTKSPEIKRLLKQLKDPERFRRIGKGKQKDKLISNVFLLAGPPGTGKTTLVRAIANKLGVPLVETSGPNLRSPLHGGGTINVNDAFNKARTMRNLCQDKNKPIKAILFIDEINGAMAGKHNPFSGQARAIENELKYQLSRQDNANEGILVFGTTNNPEKFERAMTRSGRFEVIYIGLPDEQDRKKIFDIHIQNYHVEECVKDSWFHKWFSKNSKKLSGADIEEVVKKSALRRGEKKGKEIKQADIKHELENMKKYIKKQKKRKKKSYRLFS